MKRKPFVEKVWIEEIRKLLEISTSNKNNAIHDIGYSYPSNLIPSGCGSGDVVVIKDLSSIQYTNELINKKLDLLLDHITSMKEDLGEL